MDKEQKENNSTEITEISEANQLYLEIEQNERIISGVEKMLASQEVNENTPFSEKFAYNMNYSYLESKKRLQKTLKKRLKELRPDIDI